MQASDRRAPAPHAARPTLAAASPARAIAAIAIAVAIAIAIAALTLAGCGKKGDPLPPVLLIPAATTDLVAVQRGEEAILTFTFPQTTAAGTALGGVDRLEVWQMTWQLPSADTADTADAAAGAALPTVEPRQFDVAARAATTFEAADLPALVRGDRVVVRIPLPDGGTTGREAVTLGVRTRALTGSTSELSNLITLRIQPPPPAPRDLTIEQRADGVRLTWDWQAPPAAPAAEGATESGSAATEVTEMTAVAETAEPTPEAPETAEPAADESGSEAAADDDVADDSPIVGFYVYRRPATVRDWGEPLQFVGRRLRAFLDTTARQGERYIYTVTAAAARRPVRVESAPAEEVSADYRDRFAPPSPGGLVALAEAGRVRLVWEPVTAADLAGYRVYRLDAGADEPRRLTAEPQTATEYGDAGLAAGTYVYRVTAIDRTGNESPATEATVVVREAGSEP